MTKKLGFGCMRLPLLNAEDRSSIDLKQFCEMTDLFLSRGFTYFDTAYMYHLHASERAVKEALVKRHPRDSYTLATKLPLSMVEKKSDFLPKFEEQLEKTGVEYFDYYLLHNVNGSHIKLIEEQDPFGFGLELKKQGRIKKFGFSFHDGPELLDRMLTEHPETEFVQLQLNYLDWESSMIQSRANYEVCVKHGKPVIVMEPVKGGMLAQLPPAAEELLKAMAPEASIPSWAVRFAASLPNVMMVLSGMSSLEQMENNTSYMENFVPLMDEQNAVLFKAAEIISGAQAVACTACSYCTDGCPKEIPIPKYFALYNELKRYDTRMSIGLYYKNEISRGATPVTDCLKCGACVRLCPQHLNIPELLEAFAGELEAK